MVVPSRRELHNPVATHSVSRNRQPSVRLRHCGELQLDARKGETQGGGLGGTGAVAGLAVPLHWGDRPHGNDSDGPGQIVSHDAQQREVPCLVDPCSRSDIATHVTLGQQVGEKGRRPSPRSPRYDGHSSIVVQERQAEYWAVGVLHIAMVKLEQDPVAVESCKRPYGRRVETHREFFFNHLRRPQPRSTSAPQTDSAHLPSCF